MALPVLINHLTNPKAQRNFTVRTFYLLISHTKIQIGPTKKRTTSTNSPPNPVPKSPVKLSTKIVSQNQSPAKTLPIKTNNRRSF
jgi:hypothetical protein